MFRYLLAQCIITFNAITNRSASSVSRPNQNLSKIWLHVCNTYLFLQSTYFVRPWEPSHHPTSKGKKKHGPANPLKRLRCVLLFFSTSILFENTLILPTCCFGGCSESRSNSLCGARCLFSDDYSLWLVILTLRVYIQLATNLFILAPPC